jgi:hypothetical protein
MGSTEFNVHRPTENRLERENGLPPFLQAAHAGAGEELVVAAQVECGTQNF